MKDNNIKLYNGYYIQDNVIVMKRPVPLASEVENIKKIYIFFVIMFILGVLLQNIIFIIALFCLIGTRIWSQQKIYSAMHNLVLKFKILPNINNKDFYFFIQNILISKHNIKLLQAEEYDISLLYNSIKYNIKLNNDETFTMTWDLSLGNSLKEGFMEEISPFRRYNRYKKILSCMGLIAFEIQNAYKIN